MIAKINPLDACYVLQYTVNGVPVVVLFGSFEAVPAGRRDEAIMLREWCESGVDNRGVN